MPFVLEASVTAARCFPDENSDTAEAAFDLVADGEAFVPALWWFEIRNILVVNERRGRIDPSETAAFLADLARLPVRIDREPDGDVVLAMARKYSLTAYDAAYLELARRFGAPSPLSTRHSPPPPVRTACRWSAVPAIPAVDRFRPLENGLIPFQGVGCYAGTPAKIPLGDYAMPVSKNRRKNTKQSPPAIRQKSASAPSADQDSLPPLPDRRALEGMMAKLTRINGVSTSTGSELFDRAWRAKSGVLVCRIICVDHRKLAHEDATLFAGHLTQWLVSRPVGNR